MLVAIQLLPLRWFDNRATGDLMTRVIEDVNSVERVLIDGIEQGVVAILQVLIVVGMMFYLNAKLALFALVPFPREQVPNDAARHLHQRRRPRCLSSNHDTSMRNRVRYEHPGVAAKVIAGNLAVRCWKRPIRSVRGACV